MSYISGAGGATSVDMRQRPVDQAEPGYPGGLRETVGAPRVVPDLYRNMIDSLAAVALFPALYPLAGGKASNR